MLCHKKLPEFLKLIHDQFQIKYSDRFQLSCQEKITFKFNFLYLNDDFNAPCWRTMPRNGGKIALWLCIAGRVHQDDSIPRGKCHPGIWDRGPCIPPGREADAPLLRHKVGRKRGAGWSGKSSSTCLGHEERECGDIRWGASGHTGQVERGSRRLGRMIFHPWME